MNKPLSIASNAVVAKLFNANKDVLNLVSDKLSYIVEGVEFMNAFQSGHWNGRSSFLNRSTATFPAGFVHFIHGELKSAGFDAQLVRKPLPLPLGSENPIVDEFGNDDPRYDFQLRALRQVERHGRGIIQVATGGGKSKIAKLIMRRYSRMTLFLTTRGVLMHQMRDQLIKDCKIQVGVIGDGTWNPVKGVNVGMVQTFVAALKQTSLEDEMLALIKSNVKGSKKLSDEKIAEMAQRNFQERQKNRERMIKLLSLFEVVIGEEAHEVGGDSYYEILQHCKNANIRVALTATPFMRDNAEDNMRLMAAFGPILIKVSEELLISRGILAKPYFLFKTSAPHPKLRRTSPWPRAYQLGIVEGPQRNADIVEYATKAARHKLPTLILVGRKQHGLTLRQLLMEEGVKVRFIKGENDQAERLDALRQLAKGDIDVLIGTNILDVGVDVPAVGLIILAAAGKAEVAHRQRIGRGLRAKKSTPNIAFILDFADDLNSHLKQHAAQRRAIVEGTPGFAENILKPGVDFPWELLTANAA